MFISVADDRIVITVIMVTADVTIIVDMTAIIEIRSIMKTTTMTNVNGIFYGTD